ncbi:hypothetical protein [Acinetobacter sp. HY1485]|uniref:hypothetical protein n=1 Tax=Acinetobacter sp. HY1485 TaxID=2970918 RepID=UPI0022B941FB|nr:hypothetical protein [Acinetobacter sp. HY1485]
MCGGKVAKTDPEADAQAAADKAVTETNKKKALRNGANTDSVLASANDSTNKAKTTLGGG